LHVVDGRQVGQTDVEATPDAIRAALYPSELWYGTEVELRPTEPGAPRLSVVSVSNAYVGPEGACEFMMGLEDHGVSYTPQPEVRLTRDDVAAYFERYATGDSRWLGEFDWVEVVGGQVTGRRRHGAR